MPSRTRVVRGDATTLGELRALIAECRDLSDAAPVHAPRTRMDLRSGVGVRVLELAVTDTEETT